jgi:hypothetical protein
MIKIESKKDGNDYSYFVVFTIDLSPDNEKAKEFLRRKDLYDKPVRPDIPLVEGFRTKTCMKVWVEENYSMFKTVYMLKPIS